MKTDEVTHRQVNEDTVEISKVAIRDVPISRMSLEDAVDTISGWIEKGKCRRGATANLDFLRLAEDDTEIREIFAKRIW